MRVTEHSVVVVLVRFLVVVDVVWMTSSGTDLEHESDPPPHILFFHNTGMPLPGTLYHRKYIYTYIDNKD